MVRNQLREQLELQGGVPQMIVPDNPKAMIADANRYEPRSNDTVLDFARHYGTSVLPSRPRHQRFASVAEVNHAMAPLLAQLDDKPFQKLPGSRVSTFAEIDAPALLQMP